MFDEQSFNISCDNCGHKTSKKIGWIKRNKQFSCHCGTAISLDSKEFIADLRQIEKRFKSLFNKY